MKYYYLKLGDTITADTEYYLGGTAMVHNRHWLSILNYPMYIGRKFTKSTSIMRRPNSIKSRITKAF